MQFFETVYLCFMGTAVPAAGVLFILSLAAQKRIKKAGLRFVREDTFNDLPNMSKICNSSKRSIPAFMGTAVPAAGVLFILSWSAQKRIKKAGLRFVREDTFNDLPKHVKNMQSFETVYLCFMGTAAFAAEVLFILSLTAQKRIKEGL